jgi:two-component system, NtrC family, nitrogen regulation response regulator GlnG
MITLLIAQDDEKIKAQLKDALHQQGYMVSGALYRSMLEKIERPLFEQVLEFTEGNQLKAAKILGINRNTMRTKIKKLGIDVLKWKV